MEKATGHGAFKMIMPLKWNKTVSELKLARLNYYLIISLMMLLCIVHCVFNRVHCMIFGDTKMPFDFYDIQLYGWNHAEKEREREEAELRMNP